MPIALWTALTFLIAAVGGVVMAAIGLPGGLLMGSALIVAVAAVLGFKASVPPKIRDLLFVCVGLSMGANVAPDTLHLIGQWPITLTAMVLELIVIVTVCGMFLVRVFKLDKGTAYLSSFPGHLSFIMALATTGTGDPRQIVVIQALRVMLLTLCVPIGALFLPVGNFHVGAGEEMMEPLTLLMGALACFAVGWVFSRLKVPAGYVLGAMATATTLKLTGNFPGQLPQPLLDATFIGMGALIGSRFVGISRDEFQRAAIGGLGSTAITVAIVTVTAFGLTYLVDMPFGQIWLGLAPGALEGMGALGIALGYDTAFIAAHHVFRLLLLTFAIPVVAMMFRDAKPQPLTAPSDKPDTR